MKSVGRKLGNVTGLEVTVKSERGKKESRGTRLKRAGEGLVGVHGMFPKINCEESKYKSRANSHKGKTKRNKMKANSNKETTANPMEREGSPEAGQSELKSTLGRVCCD